MEKNLFESMEKLWVLLVPIPAQPPIPYMGADGRVEFFTEQKLAEEGAAILDERVHAKTEVRKLEGKKAVYDFLRSCLKRRMIHFRLDNGSQNMRELKFEDFLDYREANLVDEKNRYVHFLFIRSQIYRYYLRTACDGKVSFNKFGMQLAETEMTMRFNGYRESYRWIMYVLAGKYEDDESFDYYTVAALDRAVEKLKDPEAVKLGYKAANLLHPGHKGGVFKDTQKGLFYVNSPGQVGNPANGMVCAFTSYENALQGKVLFERSGRRCSVVAISTPELLAEASQCAGVLVDWPCLNYEIRKEEFGNWKSYGEMDAPIIVSLKDDK